MKENKKGSAIKGIIGLVLMIAVLGGMAFAILRYENQARLNANETTQTASPTMTAQQCYTLTERVIFSTGNPHRDAVFAAVIENNADTPELESFLSQYTETWIVDEESDIWKEALSSVSESVELRPYLQMDVDGSITVAEESDPEKYLEARLPYPEDVPTSLNFVQVRLGDDEGGALTEYTRDYVIATNSADSRYTLVFPVERSENDSHDNIMVDRVTPVC